jgi:parallel beta-helix repeat protein
MTTWDPAYGDINCRDVVYEDNLVERNHDSGIFHEISYNAVIRNNVVRYNGISLKKWVWGADILVAASQDVEVHDDAVAVSVGGCGIVLVDQSRRIKGGGKYKTRNNTVRNNEMFFEGVACAGGAPPTSSRATKISLSSRTAITCSTATSIVFRERAVPRASCGGCDFRLGRASRKRSGIEGSTGSLLTIRASVATQ